MTNIEFNTLILPKDFEEPAQSYFSKNLLKFFNLFITTTDLPIEPDYTLLLENLSDSITSILSVYIQKDKDFNIKVDLSKKYPGNIINIDKKNISALNIANSLYSKEDEQILFNVPKNNILYILSVELSNSQNYKSIGKYGILMSFKEFNNSINSYINNVDDIYL